MEDDEIQTVCTRPALNKNIHQLAEILFLHAGQQYEILNLFHAFNLILKFYLLRYFL